MISSGVGDHLQTNLGEADFFSDFFVAGRKHQKINQQF